jgi:hypothetical protein
MSQQTKQPISGLRSVKRDFTPNVVKKEQILAQSSATNTAKKSLVSASMRELIAQGIASRGSNTSQSLSTTSSSSQKRAAPQTLSQPQPAKRHLPDSWTSSAPTTSTYMRHQSQMASSSTSSSQPSYDGTPYSSLPTSASSQSQGEALVIPASNSKSSSKPGSISLSHEQKAILKLVREKESLFYTGSAGT